MKKSILIAALLGLFVIVGNNASAQDAKVVSKIEKTTIDAIKTINNNKSLSDADKQKFIKRLSVLSDSAKASDKETKVNFEQEYNRIADNYARITNKSLPAIDSTKNDN